MAKFFIQISDDQYKVISDSLASVQNYSTTLPDGSPNPQSKDDFVQNFIASTIMNSISNILSSYQAKLAMKSIIDTAKTKIVVGLE